MISFLLLIIACFGAFSVGTFIGYKMGVERGLTWAATQTTKALEGFPPVLRAKFLQLMGIDPFTGKPSKVGRMKPSG